ncbi:MAG: hypothetical protein IAE94_08420 [Chthoniobacterales bacterium]|nr:hypothetical protein [Chthoniobacterales bacterium]
MSAGLQTKYYFSIETDASGKRVGRVTELPAREAFVNTKGSRQRPRGIRRRL